MVEGVAALIVALEDPFFFVAEAVAEHEEILLGAAGAERRLFGVPRLEPVGLGMEGGDMRTVLHFHPALAPVKIGVLPLSKKLNEGAEKIYAELSKLYNCEFDDRGNIGKRYRRQDEIGTPFCVTYDFESEEDGAVTVRDRDSMEQERIKIEDLKAYFEKKFEY